MRHIITPGIAKLCEPPAKPWHQDTVDTAGFDWIVLRAGCAAPKGPKNLAGGKREARGPRLGCCASRSPEGAKDVFCVFCRPYRGLSTTVPIRGLRASRLPPAGIFCPSGADIGRVPHSLNCGQQPGCKAGATVSMESSAEGAALQTNQSKTPCLF